MHSKFIFSCFLLMMIHLYPLAQDISFGTVGGINFSNLRGEMTYSALIAKPGPVSGFFGKLSLGNWLALKTGAEFTSYYYQENRDHGYYYSDFVPAGVLHHPESSSSFAHSIIGPAISNHWDYHFLRVPLVLEWKTPGRLSFGYGVGAYYQFLMNDEFTGKDKKLVSEEFRDEKFPPATDWGWIMSASLSYSINYWLRIYLEGRTTYGKEVYLEGLDGKNGSSEMIFGFEFTPVLKAEKEPEENLPGRKLELLSQAGVTFSKLAAPDEKENYDFLPAINAGVLVKYKLDNANSVITGACYGQKGYRISQPSEARWGYIPPEEGTHTVSLNSDMSLDYLTIPLLLEMSFGRRFTTSLQFGMYYSLLQNARARGEETSSYRSGSGYEVRKIYFNQGFEGWFKKNDFGGLAGLRFEYRIFPEIKIYTSLMRAYGFTTLADNKEKEGFMAVPEQLKDFKNNSWMTSLGISVPMTKN